MIWTAFLLALASCVFRPTALLTPVPLTRVTSLVTATPSPPTATPTATPTLTPTATATAAATATLFPSVQLMAVGDVMLGRSIGERIVAEGAAIPFAGVAAVLSRADLLTANLECAISERGAPAAKAYTFRAPPPAAEALALAGVDVVSLANNHALDFGPVALADTQALLAARGIATVGAGPDENAARAAAIVERNGLRLAFLAYVSVPVEYGTEFDAQTWTATADAPGVAWADPAHIAADVAAARMRADVVVVWLHAGHEGQSTVTAAQRELAYAAIDAGAALALGAHPHVLQPVEEYHGGLIAFSLGNFVFDGFRFPENYSAILTVTLTPAGVETYDFIPVVVEGGLPRLATAEEAPLILQLLTSRP